MIYNLAGNNLLIYIVIIFVVARVKNFNYSKRALNKVADVKQLELYYEIYEEQPVDQMAIDIKRDLKKHFNHSLGLTFDGKKTKFRMISQKLLLNFKRFGPFFNKSQFEIDEKNGTIRQVSRIDREEMCVGASYYNSCAALLEIFLTAENHQKLTARQLLRIIIEIQDVNDHSPIFRVVSNPYRVTFSELAPMGSGVSLPLAEDKDVGKYGIQRYQLDIFSSDFNNLFQLDIQKTINKENIVGLVLRLTSTLDREKRDCYSLLLKVIDGGNPSLSAELPIEVTVLDYNDNPPKFESNPYNLYINSRDIKFSSAGSVVGRVKATDDDLKNNAELMYSIIEEDCAGPRLWDGPSKTFNPFMVNSLNGEIYLKSYDSLVEGMDNGDGQVICRLTVQAEDSGEIKLTDQTTVNIHISFHHNENREILLNCVDEISENFELREKKILPSKSFDFELYENEPDNSVVGSVARSGLFREILGDNKKYKLIYRIHNSEIDLPFRINPKTGMVMTKTVLDREERNVYQFEVGTFLLCTQNYICDEFKLDDCSKIFTKRNFTKNEKIISTSIITVHILDVNDNSPNLTITELISGNFQKFQFPISSKSFPMKPIQPLPAPSLFAINLHNSLLTNTELILVEAADPDIGRNSELIYNIRIHPDTFDAFFNFDYISQKISTTELTIHCPDVPSDDHSISISINVCDRGLPEVLCTEVTVSLKCGSQDANFDADNVDGMNTTGARNSLQSFRVKLNLMAIGAVSALVTLSIMLVCFFGAGLTRNCYKLVNDGEADWLKSTKMVSESSSYFPGPRDDSILTGICWDPVLGDGMHNTDL